MSSNNNSDSARNPPAAPARPEFRSVQMQTNDPRYTVQRPQSMATAKPAPAARNDVINMDEFRAGAVPAAMQQETAPGFIFALLASTHS
eukprot:CAMPEP_0168786664 /NCGR_PEP_ID=MMETSP0725-20121227/11393_1 /TAXON_ID=265536 /ORGANISM="Amphiprora sp., Strain CCMP467" /LENGTH=88 /DNA_ID=CAMNT_0008836829 /DNA_START=127 /DNA_END=393 /DNA_ORIENTATION=-